MHCFVLQAIDPVLGCSILEAMLVVEDWEALRSLLGLDALSDAKLEFIHTLEFGEAQAIADRFGLMFEVDGRECQLYRTHSISEVPYIIHAGYELALMLNGVKPFAKFAYEYPSESNRWVPEALFESHV